MPNHSVSRLRQLVLCELPEHIHGKDFREFTYSYNLWLCMWADFCPENRRVQGELRRLYNVVIGDESRIRQLNADLNNVYMNIVTRSEVVFTTIKFHKVIKQLLLMALADHGCTDLIELMDQLGTILTWFKRLPVFLPSADAEWEEYKARVTRCVPPVDGETLARVRAIAKDWLGRFVLPDFSQCAHGSGSTSDVGKVRCAKVGATDLPLWRAQQLRTYAGEVYYGIRTDEEVPSRFQSVPKQLGKNRFICLEPSYLQYAQHNVFGHLRDFVENRNHPCSRFFALDDQERNRSLCSVATMSGLATLDLSNASDDVHYETWKKILHGLPLWRYIVGCRSRTLSYKDDTIQPNYIAPMGSALCFIVESIVFSLIVAVAFQDVRRRPCRGYADNVTVYGDDIICPADVAEQVISLLMTLGFTINRGKSFLDGSYRESCGVEYCDGRAITRVSHPRSVISPHNVTAGRVNMVVDLAGALAGSKFFTARRLLLKSWCDRKIFGVRARVRDVIRWEEVTLDPEYHDAYHYHEDWQSFCKEEKSVVSRNTRASADLLSWLEAHPSPRRPVRRARALGYDRCPKLLSEAIDHLVREPCLIRTGSAKLRLLRAVRPALPA